MSEYVFRIDEPIKRCFDCPFRDGLYCLASEEKPINKYRGVKTRESFCPLVELPQHGDLIDRSELLITSITDYAFERHTVVEYEDVQNAPTILEASEE